MKSKSILSVVLLALTSGVFLAGCASVPQDGKSAAVKHFDNLRDVRYAEVFLIGGNAITKDLQAAFYNTTGLNNCADPKDTCPAALWAKVDPKTLKRQYHVLAVFKNGPRHWTTDWIQLPVGTEHNFDGLKARWMGQVQLPKGVDLKKKGSTAYKPTTVARKSLMGFKAGRPVFVLVDPQGRPWVMQAYSLSVNPKLTYASLKTLGSQLKLAPGWKYKVVVLNRDLTIHAVNGIAHIVQDDQGNTYDLCAGGSSNHIP